MPGYQFGEAASLEGWRTVLAVPMVKDRALLGTMTIWRTEVQPFTDRQIALVETFADQAVIAIENARLFNETNEALEQQTATGEILRVISQSPTDVQPVFDTIVESVVDLCDGVSATVYRFDGHLIHLVAHHHSVTSAAHEVFERVYPLPPSRTSVVAQAILDRALIHVRDFEDDPTIPTASREMARAVGHRSLVAVPMLQGEEPIGVISVGRRGPQGAIRPFSDREITLLKTFAGQAVIAIENVRLFNETKEALEQQTATSEVLRAISRAHTDAQPVFDIIAASALQLCSAVFSAMVLYDGKILRLVAIQNAQPEGAEALRKVFPRPLDEGSAASRAIRSRAVVNIPDVFEDPHFAYGSVARVANYRSVLAVPMMRDGEPIGVILVTRPDPGPFSGKETELLKTFADQAVIAIENVRLFNETKEALDRQTATADILRVISSSPTDLQPVFDVIVRNAVSLCGAAFGGLHQFKEGQITLDAQWGMAADDVVVVQRHVFPLPLSRGSVTGRAILDRSVIHIRDIREDPEYRTPLLKTMQGYRTLLGVPMIREGISIGALALWRTEVQPFSETEIGLVRTFADQAVIAIENARLFSELQQKNKALTKAHAQVTDSLDQQTATSEILRVMSRSQTDVQPVFDTIVQSAVRLCAGLFGALFQFDGELLHMVAHHNYTPEALEAAHRVYPARPSRDHGSVRAIVERAVVNIPDVELDPEHQHRELRRAIGQRSGLFVPMLREGDPIGVVMVARPEPGPFSESEIDLLKTFADQAVIAIENVRLFKELEARTQDLTRSVEELTALGEVGRAVSSTLDLETVLSTIVSRAIQLSGTDGGSVYEYDEATEEFSLRASRNLPEAYVEQVRDTRPRKGEGAVGRVALTREPVQIADISDPAAYESRVRHTLLQIGLRALLAVPLIAEDRLVGALIVMRKRTGTFAAEEVTLLQTFATQSALAIQNARLFREIEDKSRQLEVASQHKSEFLANMSHELRTPLNAIIGFSEVLSDRMFGELNEKQEEYLKDIYASGTHLLSLINDILDLSKIEAGRMELELTDFHLPTALDNAIVLVRERAARHGISLHKSFDERLGQIQADERKVRQVVLNLLSNAIKFTPEGGRIEVLAAPKDGLVEVSVSDTGVGIAPEDQEAVFEEFRQVGTAAKKIEGTGLGLTLCRKFVELHGGRIWVKSELGAGSTFTFTLPVRRGE
jgi:GAF domain-containing protein